MGATATPATTPGPLEPSGPFATDAVTLTGPDGEEVVVPVYVADESSTRQRGLMEVDDLPLDAGMVFRFDGDASSAFTMRNTLLPLSIAFADADGTIVAMLDMDPCEAEPCPSYDPEATYRTALEVHQGFFADRGIDASWRLDDPGT